MNILLLHIPIGGVFDWSPWICVSTIHQLVFFQEVLQGQPYIYALHIFTHIHVYTMYSFIKI